MDAYGLDGPAQPTELSLAPGMPTAYRPRLETFVFCDRPKHELWAAGTWQWQRLVLRLSKQLPPTNFSLNSYPPISNLLQADHVSRQQKCSPPHESLSR